MERLKVAILGASGIGKFHFREFMNAGVEVVAILGSSPKSAAKTARSLGEQFGVTPKAYSKLSDLIEAEKLDAVSICTPPELHYAQTRKCLESGLHVLCEKPFVLNSRSENYELARQLVELANDGGKVLSVNTQWPAILKYIQKDVDLSKLNQFSMYMEPGASGIDMLTDHLAHTNSILVRLIPEGHAQDIKFTMPNRDEIQTSFTYSNEDSECNVDYSFKSKANRPAKREVIVSDDVRIIFVSSPALEKYKYSKKQEKGNRIDFWQYIPADRDVLASATVSPAKSGENSRIIASRLSGLVKSFKSTIFV